MSNQASGCAIILSKILPLTLLRYIGIELFIRGGRGSNEYGRMAVGALKAWSRRVLAAHTEEKLRVENRLIGARYAMRESRGAAPRNLAPRGRLVAKQRLMEPRSMVFMVVRQRC